MARPQRYRREAVTSHCLGSFVVLELLRHRPEQVLEVVLRPGVTPERRTPLIELCRRHGVAAREDDTLLRRLAHRRDVDAYASFAKYEERLRPDADHLVLLQPWQPGNLGTILRTMPAFGVHDLALIEPAADPFNPHVLRASLGARFQVRVQSYPSFEAYREGRAWPVHVFTGHAAAELTETEFPTPWTLVFGPEWPGVPKAVAAAGIPVAIPQSPAVESLNLAVAAGIAMYAARHRQRQR